MITHILAREAHVLDVQMINTGSANVALIQAGGIFAGQEFTPINKRLRDNVGYGWLSSAPANVIVGFDRNWALKRYFEIGSEIAEVAKWIEDQTERLYMTENDGFELWDSNANKTLTLNA